jgi:hypothetical protein
MPVPATRRSGADFDDIADAKLVLTDELLAEAKERAKPGALSEGSPWQKAANRTTNLTTNGVTKMAETAVSANRLELLQIADAVAREKSIDRALVLEAMADAIQRAARSRYGAENEIRAEIDSKTGEIRLSRLLQVVETVENEAIEISLEEARHGEIVNGTVKRVEYGNVIVDLGRGEASCAATS